MSSMVVGMYDSPVRTRWQGWGDIVAAIDVCVDTGVGIFMEEVDVVLFVL